MKTQRYHFSSPLMYLFLFFHRPWKIYLGVDNATWTPVPTTNSSDDDELIDSEVGGTGEAAWVKGEGDFVYVRAIGSSVNMDHPVDREIALRMTAGPHRVGAGDNYLFNIETDPTEHSNVYHVDTNADVVKRLTDKISVLRAQAIPTCQNGGVKAGTGKGCGFNDPLAATKAKSTGAWLPWY